MSHKQEHMIKHTRGLNEFGKEQAIHKTKRNLHSQYQNIKPYSNSS
jgi:hypothetical protein